MKKKHGFTLVELIIVVAIIGLLAAALYVAIDPARRLGEARDAQRWADVTAVLNAILTYTSDAGALPTAISAMTADTYYQLSGTASCGEVTGAATTYSEPSTTFRSNLVPTYIATLPQDPTYSTTTGYYVYRATGNRITVGACDHYQSGSLEVTR